MNVFAALIAVIGGGLVYIWQKKIDREEEQIRDRKEAYRSYLTALNDLARYVSYAKISSGDAKKLVEMYIVESHAKDSLELYASDAVVEAARDARATLLDYTATVTSDAPHGDIEKYSTYLKGNARCIGAMRSEFYGTKSIPSISGLRLPFPFWNDDNAAKAMKK